MTKLLLIAVGGGVGSLLRYLVAGWAQKLAGGTFPFGTLLVNISGCLLIGFLTAALTGRSLMSEEYRIGILVGVLGGYTTFSTFGHETFALLNDGQFVAAVVNIVVSVVLSVAAVWIGYRLAETWLGV